MLFQLAFLMAFPALLLEGTRRSRVLAWMGPIVLAYLTGMILGNLPGLPLDRSLSMTVAEVAVPVAIPLVLFSTDFIRWLRLARRTALSFGLATVAVTVTAILAARAFAGRVDEFWQIAGMLVGVYTGGTPNLSAIGLALGVTEETFILVNAADVVVSSVYLVFLMTVAQRVLLRFLPAFARPSPGQAGEAAGSEVAATAEARRPGRRARVLGVALALCLAAATVALGVGISLATQGRIAVAPVILTVTTAGIAASFVAAVRRLEGSYEAGQYLFLVFALAIGTLADFRELAGANPAVFSFTATVLAGSILLHYALAAAFRVDADTVIITSTAAVFSPAFVGPVAAALKNREVVVSGLTTGLVGYAVANYLGLAVAYFLKP